MLTDLAPNSLKTNEIILEMCDMEKYFPGVHALKKCFFSLNKGEVHALVGENGAGKSTLMKILAGIYPMNGGTITYKGEQVNFNDVKEAQEAGISIVHQELNLMNHLTVAQNIFIGRESKGFFINEGWINKQAQTLVDAFKINIKSTDKISELTVGKAQMVEIARAMSYDSNILILDEPTAALSETETVDLFEKIRALKDKGVSIIFITHRMGEIKQIADRVTVLRDGQYVGTRDVKTCEIEEIIHMMVGHIVYHKHKAQIKDYKDVPVVLEAKNLSSAKVKDVSFKLYKGEILGLVGLVGAGRTELMRLVFGADPKFSGEIFVNGKKVEIKNPVDAVSNGIGYLSEDRKRYGLVLGISLQDNAVLPSLSSFFVNDRKQTALVKRYIDSLNIKTPSFKQLVMNLSGGNQQKVVIAKWLIKNSDILIFDEPTRGIDVGSKAEIYDLIENLVAQGKSIIMISSELPEIYRMSDRILIMCEGRKTNELLISKADQELVMKYATLYECEDLEK